VYVNSADRKRHGREGFVCREGESGKRAETGGEMAARKKGKRHRTFSCSETKGRTFMCAAKSMQDLVKHGGGWHIGGGEKRWKDPGRAQLGKKTNP